VQAHPFWVSFLDISFSLLMMVKYESIHLNLSKYYLNQKHKRWKVSLVFNEIQARRTKKSAKRLERLVCSGLRPGEDLEKYVAELKTMTDETMDEKTIDRKTRFLKALANETRLKILELLSKREMCVCELTIALDLTQPTASHHLNILENMGLIKDKKMGKWVFYSVTSPELTQHFFKFLDLKE